jgi:long-chain acyl-CoA synthetase
MVGKARFELATSRSRTVHSNLAELLPAARDHTTDGVLPRIAWHDPARGQSGAHGAVEGVVTAELAASLASRGSSVADEWLPLLRPPTALPLDPDGTSPDTMTGVIVRQAARLGQRETVHIKRDGRWLPVRFEQVFDSAVAVAAALVHAGIAKGDRVAILGENRLEWLYCDFGIQAAGACVVPVYASSTAETVATILRDSEAAIVVCSTAKQAAKVDQVREQLPDLREIVVMEANAEGHISLRDFAAGGTVEDVDTVGRRLAALTPADPLTIIYTSGTTGVPKGVLLSHGNITGSLRAILQLVPVDETDHGISFLPWAHVFERVQGVFAGVMVGISSYIAGDLNDIGADLRAVRPTLMNGVPRMYEKMQEAIMAQIRRPGGRRAAVGLRAIEDATRAARVRRSGRTVPLGLRLRLPLWERLVLRSVRAGLGGRARVFSSGGGPINIATLEFFDALGITITEGYGLTETTGGVTANDPADPRFGTVGRATPGHEIRIAEDGEILVHGPGVMQGYFNNPAATAEVLQDGWFATGDIGELDADGYLRITDRKKDLIVTAGGKNIAPMPIEALIMQDPLVERAVVIGDRRKYLVALVVPNFAGLRDWTRANGITATTQAALAKDPAVTRLYAEIAERASAKLARYETVKKVAVLDRDLDEARGEITPTLKAKRKVVMENFAEQIEALYT